MILQQTTHHIKQLIILSAVLFATICNAQNWWGSKKIKGNGVVTTETRTIENFDAVAVGGSFDVILVNGKEQSITIEGEENIIPYLETIIKGETLKIHFKNGTNIQTTKRFVVTVPFETIEKASLAGSGNVTIKQTTTSENIALNVSGSGTMTAHVNSAMAKTAISGSGDLNLTGTAENLKASIAGSGSINAYKLQTKNVKASIAGSGDMYITVTDRIKASVAGSGSIYYKGDPNHIDSKVVGSGEIIKKN